MAKKKVLLLSPSSAPRIIEFLRGCERHGYETVPLYSRAPGKIQDETLKQADFAVCSGAKAATQSLRNACRRLGIPVIIIDLGYLKRSFGVKDLEGYNQAGWGKICAIPKIAPDAERFNLLGLEVVEKHQPTGDGYYLFAGQVGGDAQHGMNDLQMMSYLGRRAKELRPHFPKGGCVFRPHPAAPQAKMPDSVPMVRVDTKRQSLKESLDGASLIVTYNSTLGVDAMLRGIPVDSVPSAHFHPHAVADLKTRLDYLHRLAWAQWNLVEFAKGDAIEYLLTIRPDPAQEDRIDIYCELSKQHGMMVDPREVDGKIARACSACGQLRFENEYGPRHPLVRGEV